MHESADFGYCDRQHLDGRMTGGNVGAHPIEQGDRIKIGFDCQHCAGIIRVE